MQSTTLPSNRSSSNPSLDTDSLRENFGKGRIDSSQNLNYDYDETVKNASEVQVDFNNTVKMHRFLGFIQLGVLPKLQEICIELNKAYGQNAEDNLLEKAQSIFEEALAEALERYQAYLEDDSKIRSKEVTKRLNSKFHEFMDAPSQIDRPGFTTLQTQISLMKPKEKDKVQSVTGDMRLLENQSNDIAKRKKILLENIEKQIQIFLDESCSPTDNNEDYVKYSQHFYIKEPKKTDDAISEASIDIIQKAKHVCRKYIQFYNSSTKKIEIIYAIDQFNSGIDLTSLEKSQIESFKEPHKHCFKPFDKSELEKIIESLKFHIKNYNDRYIEMDKELFDFTQLKETNLRTFRGIEEYSEYRKRRMEAEAGNLGCIDIDDACRRGNLNDVKQHIRELKSDTFNIDATHDITGLTLLHCALDGGRPEVVEYLLSIEKASQGVFTNKISSYARFKYTSLHMAGAICCPRIMALCLRDFTNYSFFWRDTPPISKEWINQPTENEVAGEGYTPLHFAIKPSLIFNKFNDEHIKNWQKNVCEVVKLLLENGAMIQISNLKSAFVLALEEYNSDEMLESTLSTLSSIVTCLLNYPLSQHELRKGIKLLVSRKGDRTDLIQKILKCEYFASEPGQEFLHTQYLIATKKIREIIRANLKNPPVEIKQSTSNPTTPRNVSPGRSKHLIDKSKTVNTSSRHVHHNNQTASQVSPTQLPQQQAEVVHDTSKRAKLKERSKTSGAYSNLTSTSPKIVSNKPSISPRNSSPRNSLTFSPLTSKSNSDSSVTNRLRLPSSESLKKNKIGNTNLSQNKDNKDKVG